MRMINYLKFLQIFNIQIILNFYQQNQKLFPYNSLQDNSWLFILQKFACLLKTSQIDLLYIRANFKFKHFFLGNLFTFEIINLTWLTKFILLIPQFEIIPI
ncbi:unnamed protein product [Paramecium octaurelia]|uniref:Uncharacterized protein n=1 Tax=Paramecium octaurelia TaxID=43137 RepID=A0A8S1XM99_PAROT|nr:unnamed protein product [Paramecium octaurelia]